MSSERIQALSEKGPIKWLALFLNGLAAITLFALMLITCVDVIGRYVFNSPLVGSTELTEMAVGIVVFSTFPIISWRRENIVVDILDNYVSPKLDFIRTIIINCVSTIALYFIGQRIILLGKRSLGYGEVSEYLAIPTGWMINFIGIMCWVTAFLLVTVGIYRSLKVLQISNNTLLKDSI
ncbi:MAG: TRAP transporter small permease [Methylophilaceae bacterium]